MSLNFAKEHKNVCAFTLCTLGLAIVCACRKWGGKTVSYFKSYLGQPKKIDTMTQDTLRTKPQEHSSSFHSGLGAAKKYDVAIVGSGPAGMATACLIGALNRNLKIIVFDKRPKTTRDHKLAIGIDSIKAMTKLLEEALANPTTPVNEGAAGNLLLQFKSWSKKSIPTSTIETTLAEFAEMQLSIPVHRNDAFNIKHRVTATEEKPQLAFDQFLEQSGGARVIIGADGSKSEMRKVIGAQKTDEMSLGYLVELKYEAPAGFEPRKYYKGSQQFVMASGFDFETAGKPRDGKPGVVTLHKFVNYHDYKSMVKGNKGTPENPWKMSDLRGLLKGDQKIKKIFDHFERYLGRHKIDDKFHTISAFPMTVYRSSHVAAIYKGSVVLLVGDSSSGLVLERGVNKAFIEAALCSKAVLSFFNKQSVAKPVDLDDKKVAFTEAETPSLPEEFTQYQTQSHSLFKKEARWAHLKHFLLNTSELLFRLALSPFKLLGRPFASVFRKP